VKVTTKYISAISKTAA